MSTKKFFPATPEIMEKTGSLSEEIIQYRLSESALTMMDLLSLVLNMSANFRFVLHVTPYLKACSDRS